MRNASSTTSLPVSDANSFAIPASRSDRSPASFRRAAGGVDLRGHVGELELDRLMLGDLLAEGLALLRVAQRQLERALGDPHPAGGDVDAADLERVHHLDEALAQPGLLAAEDVLGRAVVAVEDELGGLDALVGHPLDLGRHGEARVVAGVL